MDPTPATQPDAAVVPAAKPKRPLSAFNLFYRYKRQKVLAAISRGRAEKDEIVRIVEAAPGLEDDPLADAARDPSSQAARDLRRDAIREHLKDNLLPRDTRDRAHRTNQGAMNGAMSFLELGKLMNARWQGCDKYAKGVFNELSEEGRQHYRRKLKEYNAAGGAPPTKEAANKAKAPKKEGGDTSGKRKGAGEASSSAKSHVLASGGGSANNEANARFGRLHPSDNHLAANFHYRHPPAQAPPSLQFLPHGDYSAYAGMAAPGAAPSLRTVSRDYGAPRDAERPPADVLLHPGEAPEAALLRRVRELEGQLKTERLLGRVRELEGLLGRQRTVEEELRSRLALGALSRPPYGGRAAAAPLPSPPDGLWSLASASVIHPSVCASERPGTGPPRLDASELHPLPYAAPRRFLPLPESEHPDGNRRPAEDPTEVESSYKRQRCN